MPDYEIRTVGRMGPLVASCLPQFRSVVPPATVLRAVATNRLVLLEFLEMLIDHHVATNPVLTMKQIALNWQSFNRVSHRLTRSRQKHPG